MGLMDIVKEVMDFLHIVEVTEEPQRKSDEEVTWLKEIIKPVRRNQR